MADSDSSQRGSSTTSAAASASPAGIDTAPLSAVADEWLASALDTATTDPDAARAAVAAAYTAAQLPVPAQVVLLDSPAAGAVAAALASGVLPENALPDDHPVAARLQAVSSVVARGTAGRSVRAAVRTAPWAAARAELQRRLGPEGWATLWSAAGQGVWRLVHDRLATPVRTRISDDFDDLWGQPAKGTSPRRVLLDAVGGQHDAAWLAAFDAAARHLDCADVWRPLAPLAAVSRAAGWWWPYENLVIVTARPTGVHRDNVGRLHHDDGPAIGWADGYGMHAWRGMPIPPGTVAELAHLTVERINAEENAELRRVMLEHYGYQRYLTEANAQQMHTDETGVLWRVSFTDDEDLTMVEVVNATPEPDGTSRVYWLRVPPGTRTARAGVAWTFGLSEQEYAPLVQT